jgi:hypothetical protein
MTQTLDARYSIALEHTGEAAPVYVARFCGDWLGSAPAREDAVRYMIAHRSGMVAAMLAINNMIGAK